MSVWTSALNQLKPPMIASPEEGGLGVESPADADIRAYLASLAETPIARLQTAGDVVPVNYVEETGVFFPAWHENLRLSREP